MLGSAVTCHALNARSCQQVFVSHLQMKQQCPYLYIARVSARFHSTWFHFTMKRVSSALHEETEPGAVQQHFQAYSCHRAEADCGVTALPRPLVRCWSPHLPVLRSRRVHPHLRPALLAASSLWNAHFILLFPCFS